MQVIKLFCTDLRCLTIHIYTHLFPGNKVLGESIVITLSVRLSISLVNESPFQCMNWYWWNFSFRPTPYWALTLRLARFYVCSVKHCLRRHQNVADSQVLMLLNLWVYFLALQGHNHNNNWKHMFFFYWNSFKSYKQQKFYSTVLFSICIYWMACITL